MSGYNKRTKIFKSVIQAAPFVMIGVCAILYFVLFRNITVEQLLKYTPENIWLAAIVIIGMFSLKSLSFFFPMMVIVIVCGKISPNIPIALLINIIGVFCMTNIPYFIGKFAERDFVEKLIGKYKKMQKVRSIRMNNELFFVYFLRAINCLPYDVISLFLGSSGIKWQTYIIGSLLGTLPSTILTTIMGINADEPLSAGFIVPLGLNVIQSIISASAYLIYLHRKKKKAKISER